MNESGRTGIDVYRNLVQKDIVDTINKMIAACEPINYDEFNLVIQENGTGVLNSIESEDDRIGIRPVDYKQPTGPYAISVATIIATLTHICVGKRLAFVVDDGIITGVQWYNE